LELVTCAPEITSVSFSLLFGGVLYDRLPTISLTKPEVGFARLARDIPVSPADHRLLNRPPAQVSPAARQVEGLAATT
jgi:hypothetical protein